MGFDPDVEGPEFDPRRCAAAFEERMEETDTRQKSMQRHFNQLMP